MRGEPLYAVPKFRDGAKTLQAERATKGAKAESAETTAKRTAKKRDGHKCRWPHARGERGVCRRMRLESAHYLAKSLGGQNHEDNLITCCLEVHQGPVSLHSGDLRIVPLTRDRMDGPVEFRQKVKGKWVTVGREISVGVLERTT